MARFACSLATTIAQGQGWRPPRAGRLLAAYLDRPLFPENFSAAQSLDSWSGRSLHDWTTFHNGGLRLVEYLQYAGYNGLMISVAADGSAIYPSELLEPTPRYDTGMFFGTGQDRAAQGRAGNALSHVRPRGLAVDSLDRVCCAAAATRSPASSRRPGQRGHRVGRAGWRDLVPKRRRRTAAWPLTTTS